MRTEVTMIGCGLILAGFAAENFVAHRWLAAGRPAQIDTCSVLAFALPVAGLTLMAALSA